MATAAERVSMPTAAERVKRWREAALAAQRARMTSEQREIAVT